MGSGQLPSGLQGQPVSQQRQRLDPGAAVGKVPQLLEKHIGPFVAASTSTSIAVSDTSPPAGDSHEEVKSPFKVMQYTAPHSKGSR